MLQKPKHLGPEYAAVFQDQSVAEAYPHRAPYPPEVYAKLRELIVDEPRNVLELGCGTGEISRTLAPEVDRADAGDPSEAMIEVGRGLPNGGHSNLSWHASSAEEFSYDAGYSMILTPESLGWLDWEVVFPKMRLALSPHGRLVVLMRGHNSSWGAGTLDGIVPRYSTNVDFAPYDLIGELEKSGLFVVEDRVTTQPVPVCQSIDDYIEFWHSRSGFSRERMGTQQAERFDDEVRKLVSPHSTNEMLHYDGVVHMVWGVPGPSAIA